MKTYTATVTAKGQMTLPVAFRKELDIAPATKVRVSLQNHKIVIESDDYWQQFERLQAKVQAHRRTHKTKPLSDDEIRNLRAEAWSPRP